MAMTLAEARKRYEEVFGLAPAATFDAGDLERAVARAGDLNFVRGLYEKEFGTTIAPDDTRDAGFLLRAVRNNNELQSARAAYEKQFGVQIAEDDPRDAGFLQRAVSNVTDPSRTPGVASGGTLIRVPGPGGSTTAGDRWYQVYEFPAGSGQFIAYQYNDLAQVGAATGQRNPPYAMRSQTWFDQKVLAQAPAEEIIGLRGSFGQVANTIMADAARAAGVRDPSLVGRIASNPEMQRIMALAVQGKWTDEQILAEQRKTNFWKTELYPGIENLYGRSTNPERDYKEYVASVTPALTALGYKPSSAGDYNQQIKKMLDKKIDAGVFLAQVPTFIQATQNAEFATALNQWAQRDLGRTVGFNDWFDLMAGESQPELEAVAERAQLQWVSDNQGSQLSQSQIEDLSNRTQLSADEARRAFSEFNQGVLALGEQGLGKYGLSRDEVLSAAAGVTPASGRSVDEVKLLVAKTARELAMFDDDKINFYVGFSPQGTPIRPGLSGLAPEGA